MKHIAILIFQLEPSLEGRVLTPLIPFERVEHAGNENDSESKVCIGLEWKVKEGFAVFDNIRHRCTSSKELDEKAIVVVAGQGVSEIFKAHQRLLLARYNSLCTVHFLLRQRA